MDNQLNKVEREIHKVLEETLIKQPTNQEINRAQQLVRNSLCFSLELTSNVASLAASQALWGRRQSLLSPLENIDYWTKERLQKEVFCKLQPTQCTTLIARSSK